MKTINLSIYLSNCQYFKLFDVLLKDQTVTKEAFLIENNITPSSYRRARNQEVNVGNKIISKLSNILGYTRLTEIEIRQIEERLNDIHNKVYYKIYDGFEEDLEYVELYLKKKTLLFPIFLLFKVFMIFNKHVSCLKVIDDEEETFKTLKRFNNFYSDSLLEIYDFIECAFTKQVPSRILEKSSAYPMVYQVLASKYSNEHKYFESNYFAQKAFEIYIRDNNYKRALYAIFPFLFNLNQLGNYEEVFKISYNHISMLKSFGCEEFEYDSMLKHLVVSAFGLKEYHLIVSLLENRKQLNFTLYTALLVSIYLTDQIKYEKVINEILKEKSEKNNKNILFFSNLHLYLTTKDKNALNYISRCSIYETLITLVKKI